MCDREQRPPDREIERRLEDAEHTLEAIQNGSVDAVVVHGPHGPQIYSLEGPDQPFRTLVEAMQEGAVTLDRFGTVVYANCFLAGLLGKPVEEVIGAAFGDFVQRSFRYTFDQLIERGMQGPTKATLRLNGPDGAIPVQLTLSPLALAAEPTCCGVLFDLREREQAEHANAAREAAEQASAAKDQFLAMLSHELRSPLGTILGWAQMLGMRDDLDDSVRHAIQTIERNAKAQTRLISELLDLSRFMAGKLHLENEVVDFKQIVSAAVISARIATDKTLEIKSDIDDADCYVYGDSTRLQQVVTNLLHNATKFTESGGKIRISLRSETDGDGVRLAVSDTGPGIPRNQLPHLFEFFRQGDDSIKQRKGGLGLGLAIAKQLVDAHGGEITAESDGPGTGATFTVRLPRVSAPEKASTVFIQSGKRLSGIHVLLVDDETDLLDVTRHVLEQEGASVKSAQSAAAALDLLSLEEFSVLVSDIGLPEQDGLALLREVRARGFGKHRLPAIALTGFAGKEHARLAEAAGFQLHVAKPVDTRSLVRAVEQLTTIAATDTG